MKAIQVTRPGVIEVVDRDIPDNINCNEALVQTKAAGICGSDMHIYHGTSPVAVYPRVIGHEAVGEVVKVGIDVKSLSVGDHVVLEPIEYCGVCYACRMGRPNVCQNLKVRGVNSDGGFAEYFVALADKLHRLPTGLPWEKAVLIEPFSIGAQVCFRGDIRENDLVLIYGAGPAGLSVLENAKINKAICIIADFNEKRLEFALRFGADYVINPQKLDLRKEIERISGQMMCNVIVDAVGSPEVLEEAMTLASVAGRIVCMGFTDTYAKVSLLDITKKELSLVGSRLQTHQFERCIKAFSELKVNTVDLITHRFRFDEVKKAIDLIDNHPQEVGKIILLFD